MRTLFRDGDCSTGLRCVPAMQAEPLLALSLSLSASATIRFFTFSFSVGAFFPAPSPCPDLPSKVLTVMQFREGTSSLLQGWALRPISPSSTQQYPANLSLFPLFFSSPPLLLLSSDPLRPTAPIDLLQWGSLTRVKPSYLAEQVPLARLLFHKDIHTHPYNLQPCARDGHRCRPRTGPLRRRDGGPQPAGYLAACERPPRCRQR